MKLKLLFAAALLLSTACRGRPRTGELVERKPEDGPDGPGKVLVFDFSEGAPESTASGGLFPLPATRSYVGLVRALERARVENTATAYFVRLGGGELGWSRTEELAGLFGALKDQGKPVVCHAHSISNSSSWLLTRGCTRVWLSPAGDVDTTGIAAQVVYLKAAMDKLKVQADFLHMGKYKSAAEPLTHEGPSPETRESLTSTLGSIRQSWLAGVHKARPAVGVPEVLEAGPWSPEEAKARGIVDAIGYESQALDDAKERGDAGEAVVAFGPDSSTPGFDIGGLVRILAGADEATGGRPHIAVLPAQGSISMEAGGPFESGGITARSLSKTIRKLTRDDSVKAVVLRIDSPGGSALASDLLWHELSELRKKKPLIASVGDMAASGGYYMACAANKIIAEPTSIVGSIGVVGGKIVFGPALEQFGVSSFTFPASDRPGAAERAAYMSALTPWDDPTRDRVRSQMSAVYELFLQRVAAGRGTTVDAIRPHAEGRIWSGAQGKERGLVDELGGLKRAIALARELGKVDEKAPITVEGASESLIESLLVGEGASAAEVEVAWTRAYARRTAVYQWIPEPIRPLAAGLSPLLAGERTLVLLPFAISVR